MTIVLFAIIGSTIKAGTAYWVCFGIFCALRVICAFLKPVIDYIKEHE